MPKQCFWRELSGAVFGQAAPTQVVGQVGSRDAVKSPNPLLEARVVGIDVLDVKHLLADVLTGRHMEMAL